MLPEFQKYGLTKWQKPKSYLRNLMSKRQASCGRSGMSTTGPLLAILSHYSAREDVRPLSCGLAQRAHASSGCPFARRRFLGLVSPTNATLARLTNPS